MVQIIIFWVISSGWPWINPRILWFSVQFYKKKSSPKIVLNLNFSAKKNFSVENCSLRSKQCLVKCVFQRLFLLISKDPKRVPTIVTFCKKMHCMENSVLHSSSKGNCSLFLWLFTDSHQKINFQKDFQIQCSSKSQFPLVLQIESSFKIFELWTAR